VESQLQREQSRLTCDTVALPSRERVRVRGQRPAGVILGAAGDPVRETTRSANQAFPTHALHGRAGPVTFCSRAKSNQKRLPLHPASSCGARKGRAALDIARTRRLRVANSAMQCRYNRPLLRSSARAEGAVEPTLDRFRLSVRMPQMETSAIRPLLLHRHESDITILQAANRSVTPPTCKWQYLLLVSCARYA
jgi:hypothetical protein